MSKQRGQGGGKQLTGEVLKLKHKFLDFLECSGLQMIQLLNAISLPTGIKETVSVLSSDPSNKGGKA